MEANFSHILGTLAKTVGETSRRFSGERIDTLHKVNAAPAPNSLEQGDEIFINMGQGKIGDHFIGLKTLVDRDKRFGHTQDVAMADHSPFRTAGGSGGIDDHGRIIGLQLTQALFHTVGIFLQKGLGLLHKLVEKNYFFL